MKVAHCVAFFAACFGFVACAEAQTASGASGASVPSASLEAQFKPNDTVVFLGATFLEREGDYGHLETALSTAWPQKALKFRNLAWSGDTVWGSARSYFGPPAEGLQRLSGHLALVKPNVVVCQYGSAEAWDGPAKIPAFIDQYKNLLDLIAKAPSQPRVLLVSPLPCISRQGRDLAAQNQNLAQYRDAIQKLAAERSLAFFDAYQWVSNLPDRPANLSVDGVNISEDGYAYLGKSLTALLSGSGAPAATPEPLRTLIREKNRLFFHRWRPANETYLFGFRKHEQGNNGAEIPLFDPLIDARDKEIAQSLTGGPKS